MKVRPSSLPMLAKCPQWESSGGNTDTNLGSQRHAALAALFQGDKALWNALPTDNDREAVEWAAEYIRVKAPMNDYPVEWEVKRRWLGADFQEREGTPDCVCGPVVFDFKWRQRDYTAQMADYSLERLDRGFEMVEVHLLYGEPRVAEVLHFDRESAEGIVQPILEKAGQGDPAPCDYCGWCAKRLICPAMTDRVAAVVEGREDWQLDQYHASKIESPAEMGKALRIARLVADWCEAVEFAAKEMAVKRGQVPAGFKIQNRQGARFIASVLDAFPKAGLPQDEFLKACDVKLSALAEAYAEFHGMKKAPAERELESKLGPVVQRKQSTVSLVAEKEKA